MVLTHLGSSFATLVVCTGLIIGLGWWATDSYMSQRGTAANSDPAESDPAEIVIDEWAGMWIVLLGVQGANLLEVLLAFALFRFFDITKPWIVGQCDRMHGTRGIMLDDIAAGILALLCLIAFQLLMPLVLQ
jgi:phosphatidylglycerophosphatase A